MSYYFRFSVVPLCSILLSSIPAVFSGGFSFLWAIGSLALGGAILLIWEEKNIPVLLSKTLVAVQLVIMFLAAAVKDPAPGVCWTPKILLYSLGTCVPVCITLVVFTILRCRDNSFMAGYYPAACFIREMTVYIFVIFLLTLFLGECSLFGAGKGLRLCLGLVFMLMAVLVFLILTIRFSLSYETVVTGRETEIPSEQEIQLFHKIEKLFDEERPFLMYNYSIDDIARALCSNRGYISRCVNSCAGVSVPRLVNSYRIRYAMELYNSNLNLKVAEIASMSGFGTAASFAAAFKIETKMNPGDWCRERREFIIGKRQRRRRQHPSSYEEQEPEQ